VVAERVLISLIQAPQRERGPEAGNLFKQVGGQMSHKTKILKGSASNLVRVVLSMLLALVLPRLLVHRLSPAEYSAWVLILQISAYISLLDLGLQTAVGKLVAEYDAVGDRFACSRTLSSSVSILSASAAVGAVTVALVAWQVPRLFQQMPADLIGDVRVGILVVGMSTVFALPFGAFLAAFTGLQSYGFPTALATGSRILTTAGLATLLVLHGNLIQMAWLLAVFNIATAIGQFLGWKRYAKKFVGFSFRIVDQNSIYRLFKYGSALSIWTCANLFVSGLDMVIVGHYDFRNTGYYGIATSVNNFMLLVVSSLFGPIVPAVSSLQSGRTSEQVGDMVIKATRYCVLLLCLIGLPLLIGPYTLLTLWVGHDYAIRSGLFLRILVLGNVIRQFANPYALVLLATGQQHLATVAAVAEALVNLGLSIYLVQRFGAVGVAVGTLVGAFVSVGLHLAVSMKLTRSTISMSRRKFLLIGLLRPLLCVIPSLLLVLVWKESGLFSSGILMILLSFLGTAAIGWLLGLTNVERNDLMGVIHKVFSAPLSRVRL
jgi:O-antigen/teichoic acid export membrane protein